MSIFAVDVGINNGFAVVDNDGDLLIVGELPIVGEGAARRLALAGLRDLLVQFHVDRAILEDGHSMPKQGPASTYRYGRACGSIEGALSALQIPTAFVRPSVWKRNLGVNSAKANMRAAAAQTWPRFQSSFELVKHQHRAEAALLGRWFLGREAKP